MELILNLIFPYRVSDKSLFENVKQISQVGNNTTFLSLRLCVLQRLFVLVLMLYSIGKAEKKKVFTSPKMEPVHLAIAPEELSVSNKITFCMQDTSPISGLYSQLNHFCPNNLTKQQI